MATSLAGLTALVTGATSGIGREVALQLAEHGAEVVVHGRSAERGAKTVRDIQNAGGKARFVAADLNSADDVRRLAAEAGPVDILINNAGIYKFGGTLDVDDATFEEHVNVNLRAPYILVQQLVPTMVGRGGGAVVNVSTLAASVPTSGAGIYGATKAGLEQLTRVWADEFGKTGVRVNAIAVGPTDTPRGRGHAGRAGSRRGDHHAGPARRTERNRRRGSLPEFGGSQLCQRRGLARDRRATCDCGLAQGLSLQIQHEVGCRSRRADQHRSLLRRLQW